MSASPQWIAFPDERFELRGLPWFEENAPRLWRLPDRAMATVPERVASLAHFPGGGRIRLATDTSQLRIKLSARDADQRRMAGLGTRGLDTYVDGRYWNSVCVGSVGEAEYTFFEGAERSIREITIYLPLFQEIEVVAIGVDVGSVFQPPPAFPLDRPLVLYGSSIAQGAGTCRPGLTYQAILARQLDLDFVNLGFGGAGRAEPEVVELVAELEACCFLFDLGKSYGRQPKEVYAAMLEMIRDAHPEVPLICMTPIFSSREFYSAEYVDLSEHTRRVMREAATERIDDGDENVFVVEGLDLVAAADADGFYEGVHPNALGYTWTADRLKPTVEKALFGG